MSAEKHIADAESRFMVVNIAPDFCVVGNQVVPFDIVSILPPRKLHTLTPCSRAARRC